MGAGERLPLDQNITCMRAAQRGDLAMLQWARDNGCDWDRATCLQGPAAAEGSEMRAWILAQPA